MASSCTPATSWERGTTVVSAQSSDGNEFAAKFYKAGQCEVQTELDVFRQLCHPNIVVAYGVVTSHMEVGLLLEKGCGNFGKYLRGLPLREPLDPKKVFQRWQLSSQLAQGLRHVHSRGLVHGDPKPSNAIVFEAPLAAKWSDFGTHEDAPCALRLAGADHGTWCRGTKLLRFFEGWSAGVYCDPGQHNALLGVRIGEAQHPGPSAWGSYARSASAS